MWDSFSDNLTTVVIRYCILQKDENPLGLALELFFWFIYFLMNAIVVINKNKIKNRQPGHLINK